MVLSTGMVVLISVSAGADALDTRCFSGGIINDIEFTEEFATWAQHLIEQKPLIIPDVEQIRESKPKEYEAYQRLEARSIMGVPFGQHPLGFMVIRNMKQYTDRPEPLQLACFVTMMMLEQIRRTRMEKLTKMHDEDDGRFRIRYNILGPHNFVIDGKEIYEQDLPHPNRHAWMDGSSCSIWFCISVRWISRR